MPPPEWIWKPLQVSCLFIPQNRLVFYRARKHIEEEEYLVEISATQKKFYILVVNKSNFDAQMIDLYYR